MTVLTIKEFEEFLKEQQSNMLAKTTSAGLAHQIINLVFEIMLAELKIRAEDEDRRFEEYSKRFDERAEMALQAKGGL